jgi:hypothetical protein
MDKPMPKNIKNTHNLLLQHWPISPFAIQIFFAGIVAVMNGTNTDGPDDFEIIGRILHSISEPLLLRSHQGRHRKSFFFEFYVENDGKGNMDKNKAVGHFYFWYRYIMERMMKEC